MLLNMLISTNYFNKRGENLMDADGNKGAVPGRSCSRMNAFAFILF